jgi:hypothetical protein
VRPAGQRRREPERARGQRQLDAGRLGDGQGVIEAGRGAHTEQDAPPGAREAQLRMFYLPDEPGT